MKIVLLTPYTIHESSARCRRNALFALPAAQPEKMKMVRTNYEVGGPDLAFETWVLQEELIARRNPGLKSETRAIHSSLEIAAL
jgi:hypothetical protein